MINVYKKPKEQLWKDLAQRPLKESSVIEKEVAKILEDVKRFGDTAIQSYTSKFDNVNLSNFRVEQADINKAAKTIDPKLKKAINIAAQNIQKFHAQQVEVFDPVETMPGVLCWRKSKAIENVGLYIPGGTAPLISSLLMLAIPAKIAGCKNIFVCTPPSKKGNVSSAILYTAKVLEIEKIYMIGGVQAIAAMAYGTETIPKVDKIFGPGNQYVTKAKSLVQIDDVAIDLPAGPSEVLIIAGANSNPKYVAADLLSQAEHGEDSEVVLLSDSIKVIERVLEELKLQVSLLPRKAIALESLSNSKAILFNSIEDCFQFSNYYAPEHLIVNVQNEKCYLDLIVNAGSVFIGQYSCESIGDYASGTNHTLPTNGLAKSYSGVSVDSFVKKITFQKVSDEGIRNIGPTVEVLADAEQLYAHKQSVSLRLKDLNYV